MHGIPTTPTYYTFGADNRPVNFRSSSSSSFSSSSSGSSSSSPGSGSISSDSLSFSSFNLSSTVDDRLTAQDEMQATESVEKYLSSLDPLYKFTARRIREGALSPSDAIKNEATITSVWMPTESGDDGVARKKCQLHPIYKDVIISGLVTFEKVQKMISHGKFTDRSLDNLRHPPAARLLLSGRLSFKETLELNATALSNLSKLELNNQRYRPLERLFRSGQLSFKEALNLSDTDLSYLSKPETQDWIFSPAGSVFLALV